MYSDVAQSRGSPFSIEFGPSGISCGSAYYWAVVIVDDAGNRTLSNVVSAAQQSCGSHQEVVCN